MRATFVLGCLLIASPVLASPPTFSKDVAPILFKSCVECHRPTAMAPMSLLTYDDARPWARAIKQKVAARQMPPWGADPHVGKFSNDVSLKQAEIDTIAAWVDGGSLEGDRKPSCRRRRSSPRAGRSASPIYVFKMHEAVHRAGRRHGARTSTSRSRPT